MNTLIRNAPHPKIKSPRRFLLTYRRLDWSTGTAAKYRYFGCESEALAFLERLRGLARFGPVAARLEVLERGRWRVLPLRDGDESGGDL